MAPSQPPTLQERHKTAASEFSSLGRVSHKLALVDNTERLQQVLDKLLPRLLKRIGDNHSELHNLAKINHSATDAVIWKQLKDTYDKIHARLVEMLSHTMKRVRNDQGCKLPCHNILALLLEDPLSGDEHHSIPKAKSSVDPFTLNLALAFLTLGIPRCSTIVEVENLLPELLVLAGQYSGLSAIRTPAKKMQSMQVAHLLLRAIEWLVKNEKAITTKRKHAKKDTTVTVAEEKAVMSNMTRARMVCQEDTRAAGAVFDLVMDGLLYQAVNGNVPPNGMSQAGHERLQQGSSTVARNWAAEKGSRMELMQFKLTLLDFVAPSRKWAIFMSDGKNDADDGVAAQKADIGISRTVALLVVASGDPNVEVASRATMYLKMHHDSFRGPKQDTGRRSRDNGATIATSDIYSGPLAPGVSSKGSEVGESVNLVCGLLSLALGQTNAESAMAKLSASNRKDNSIICLGLKPEQADGSDSSQLVLSLKRRSTSESTTATIMNYVADKILDDNPHLFGELGPAQVNELATLPLLASQATLFDLRTSSGLSVLQARAYVAAAKLLNIMCVRLATFYDSMSLQNQDLKEKEEESGDSNMVLLNLMARALSAACFILTPASTPMSSSSGSAIVSNEGNIAIRDACYGVVCSLSRSRFVLAPESYIFTGGKASPSMGGNAILVATDTASLLFGCASNEVDRLRPRAVAGLDALLGAFCRVYCTAQRKTETPQIDENSPMPDVPSNPWLTVPDFTQPVVSGKEDSDTLTLDMEGLTKALLPLLWSAGQTARAKASRVAAARWASDLLKELDIASASHLLVFLAGDSDVTTSAIASEGLGLPSKQEISSLKDDDFLAVVNGAVEGKQEIIPDFASFTAAVFPAQSDAQSSLSMSWRPQYWDFSSKGKAAALRFGLICLFNDVYGGSNGPVKVFISVLTDTLALYMSKTGGVTEASKVHGSEAVELLEECTRCLLATISTSQYTKLLLVKDMSSETSEVSLSLQDIECLSQTVDSSRARRYLAAACGYLYDEMSLWTNNPEPSPDTMQHWLVKSGVERALNTCAARLTDMQSNLFSVGDVHGAAFLGAQCARSFRLWAARAGSNDNDAAHGTLESSCWEDCSKLIKGLGLGILHSDDVVANSCSDALALALDFQSIDAPRLDTRLYSGAGSALNHLASALKKFSSADHLDASRTVKLTYAAGRCLAASTSGAGATTKGSVSEGLGPSRLACVDALFSLLGSAAFRVDEEVALVTGEALALYADSYAPDSGWSCSVEDWPKEFEKGQIAEMMPPHQQILYRLLRGVYLSSSPHKKTACAAAMLGIVGRAAQGVNKKKSYSKRFLVVELNRHMSEILALFIALLSNPKCKQLSREACCLGLAACRGITKNGISTVVSQSGESFCADELNHRLLRAFGHTTNFGGSAYQETHEQAAARRAGEQNEFRGSETGIMEPFGGESEIGGQAGLGESALNSYKEMAAAAMSLGRIDVFYALLMLSVSHVTWFTSSNKQKYGASALLGDDSIVGGRANPAELRTALRPHLGKLLPRILRACHDPNKQTREQMNTLWIGLTGGGAEARSLLSQHLLATVDTLIEDCTNKLWRARAGACGALSDIIVGRSWDDLGGGPAELSDDDMHTKTTSENLTAGIRLLRLFRVAMRALDDVRGNVREAGEILARSVRGLSVRLCNPSLKDASDGTHFSKSEIARHEMNTGAASATTLRWLIKYGLNQACAEATGICLSCLVEIVGVVKPKILQPLIPGLLKSLLCSMSGLEPAALNYLQARSGSQDTDSSLSYENLERVRLRLAQSGPLAAAVTKLLFMIPSIRLSTQKEVVPELDAALRQSVGFATRAATADAVALLTTSCPDAFRFPGTSNTNPSVRLLRALYFASERENGQGAREKMIHALGNLAGLCPGSSVRILAMKACETYNRSTGHNDDPASRRASAAALRSIAVRAANQLQDGGSNDIWFRRVLPVAYLGKKDNDSKIAQLWREVYEEGSIAINMSHASGEDGFGTTTEEKLLPYLVREACQALEDLSWTRRVAGSSALVDLCAAGLLAPSPATSNIDSYTSTRSQRRAKASSAALNVSLRVLSGSRLWTGKSQVIVSAVSIAAKWAWASTEDELDKEVLFGWGKRDERCPWQVIVVSPGEYSDDLFVDDNWLRQINSDDKEEFEGQLRYEASRDMEIDAAKASSQLDIDGDCDELLENEDAGPESNVEERMTAGTSPVTFAGLARFLLEEAMPMAVSKNIKDSDEFLPYRVAALTGLKDLMLSLDSSSAQAILQKKELYTSMSPRLASICDLDNRFSSTEEKVTSESKEPPVIVARAIDCLGALFWNGIGLDTNSPPLGTSSVLELARFLLAAGGSKQPAWTVREASWLCAASLASTCHPITLRNHHVVSAFIDGAAESQKDRKFWRVRFAGLKILYSLVVRAGTKPIESASKSKMEQERQLLLEAMLPQKEVLLSLLRKALSDPEAKVTALSSDIVSTTFWWP